MDTSLRWSSAVFLPRGGVRGGITPQGFQTAQQRHRCLRDRHPRPGSAPPLSVRCLPPQVLNEVVIDRGPSSYLSNVDVYLDGHLITTVQGDGTWPRSGVGTPGSTRVVGAWIVTLRPCGFPQA